MSNQVQKFDQTASNSKNMAQELNSVASSKVAQDNIISTSEKVSSEITSSMASASKRIDKSNTKLEKTSEAIKKSKESILKTGDLLESVGDVQKSLEKNSDEILDIKDTVKGLSLIHI